jgi:16S rRNA (guanine966-N2)-methyltransferase
MADKIREAAFSSMESLGIAPDTVLDLYAGSGAVGIEALSRGALSALFVDRDRIACQTVRRNLRDTGFEDRGKVVQATVDRVLSPARQQYDLIILDPPYADPDILETIEKIDASGAAGSGSILLLGHWPRLDVPERIGRFHALRRRCHGDSCFSIFEWSDRDNQAEEC